MQAHQIDFLVKSDLADNISGPTLSVRGAELQISTASHHSASTASTQAAQTRARTHVSIFHGGVS